MPLTHLQLIVLLAVPFAAAVVAVVIGRLTGKRQGGDGDGESAVSGATWSARLAPPLAIAIGPVIALVFGSLFLKDLGLTLNFKPREPFDWYLLAPLAALIVGVLAIWIPRRFTMLVVAVAGSLLALCLSVKPGMTVPIELWPAVAAPGILFGVLEPIGRRNQNPAMLIILLLLAGSSTVVKLDSSSINLGISCFPLSAAILGLLITYPLLLDRDFSRAALPAFVLIWMAMLFYGFFWADVPWQRALLIAAAPIAAYAADIPPLRWTSPFWRATLRVVLVAIPLCFAVIPAARDLRDQMREQMQGDL